MITLSHSFIQQISKYSMCVSTGLDLGVTVARKSEWVPVLKASSPLKEQTFTKISHLQHVKYKPR